jgi:L-malate glycosyltransferase
MKILITIPCLLTGGTEMQTLHLARALISLDYTVCVICYFEYDMNIVRRFQDAGAKVVLCNPQSNGRPKGFRLLKELNMQFRAILKEYQPDIVHVQYMAPGLLPILISRFAGVKRIIATVHQTADQYNRKHRYMLRSGALLCSRFVSVSSAAHTSWFGNGFPDKKNRTIYNTVDEQEIYSIITNNGRPRVSGEHNADGKIIIGVVSRLRYEKGVDVLIEALEQVKNVCPSFVCLIVGDGRARDELRRLAGEKNLNDMIIWSGSVRYEEAISYMNRMDIVVCPSRTEGFGLTALEAMFCGKPVVASRTGGLPEVVEDNATGLLFEPENPGDISDKLIQLISNRALRNEMGKKGRNRAEKEFGFDIFKERIRQLYEEVLNQ